MNPSALTAHILKHVEEESLNTIEVIDFPYISASSISSRPVPTVGPPRSMEPAPAPPQIEVPAPKWPHKISQTAPQCEPEIVPAG